MNHAKKDTIQIVVQFLQLATLIIGVAVVFMAIGRKDATIDSNSLEIRELRDIAADLVRATVESTSNDRSQDRQLDDLRARILLLENDR